MPSGAIRAAFFVLIGTVNARHRYPIGTRVGMMLSQSLQRVIHLSVAPCEVLNLHPNTRADPPHMVQNARVQTCR
jgi:hypothetical protein